MKRFLIPLLALLLGLAGCAMFRSWQAIPPPGGCDQCHTQPISNDWQVAYRPVTLTDETGRHPWQRPESMAPPETSPLKEKMLTEQRCFRCHKGPNRTHAEYKGRYHH
jgi:hypothetical protein